ncbi:MAG: multidrug efflux RND transporter permease subunit [Magnetococcales bacterium]|nr:multidrug efflux RND transporter permease subunit [Magnetococcales bacterium]
MNFSAIFVRRPVATSLLTLGVVLAGLIGFLLLPVAPLPQVDFPTISVSASLPGASPETMAATVASPLERTLGRIAGVTEITSTSSLGSSQITLQFDLSRDINGAARDVQAGISAASALLPTGLPSNPTYRKVNPADMPIMILVLTSEYQSQGKMYDLASTVLAQRLSQLEGVGQVRLGGSSLPAVRVELDPGRLDHNGIGFEDVRMAIATTNANRPKGVLEQGDRQWSIEANDKATEADHYRPIIVTWRNHAPVRLGDLGKVEDSVQDLRNAGSADGKPSVLLIISRQPGANIIDTVDRINQLLPVLRSSVPAEIDLSVLMDRTPTIRASLREVERSLLLATALVILVVFLFLRNARAALIPTVAVPVSLVGTFGVMYLLGYSLDNLSLMALTIATGFVVDDAIVVLENVTRYLEQGYSPLQATLRGVREVGFTVFSMSLSLVAVFIPILAMGGIVGRLFREFAVTLGVAVLVSLVVSLTTTPAMCARLLRAHNPHAGTRSEGWFARGGARVFQGLLNGYERTLDVALRHSLLTLMVLLITIGLNVYLYINIPKGFFPQQDIGRLMGSIQGDQGISFQAMRRKMDDFIREVGKDPAVEHVMAFTGGGQRNSGMMFVSLKPRSERGTQDEVMARLRGKLSHEAGADLFLQPTQEIRVGGRSSSGTYQYTLQSSDLDALRLWEPRIRRALTELPQLTDVSSDQNEKGLSTLMTLDRASAARLGVTPRLMDAVLNDAYGQRLVSTIYTPLNQYRVVMEAAPPFLENPASLGGIHLGTASGAQVPLAAVTRVTPSVAPLAVNHQGLFAASTISFNLAPGVSLSQATEAIEATFDRLGTPVQGGFQGTAKVFQASLENQPWLILAALFSVYIVLGILYESYIHPLTIISTLPSAGVGALLALWATGNDFNLMAMIGVVLLIGIVKKNAIMMIDFALARERGQGIPPQEAIRQACLLRFRPILMTTLAALFGALPLALGSGDGSELRHPLGISIVGGLLLSQLLTLYTTPVVYLYLDRMRLWFLRRRGGHPVLVA